MRPTRTPAGEREAILDSRPGVDQTVPGTTPLTTPSWVVDLAESRVVGPSAVAKLALRYELTGTDELVARLGSGGAMTAGDIVAAARACAAGRPAPTGLSSAAAYSLALVEIGTPGGDVQRAADLFTLARQLARRSGSRVEHPDTHLQTSLAAGRLDEARALIDAGEAGRWVRWAASADLVNPFGSAAARDTAPWLEVFNQVFDQHGLSRVAVADPARPFDSVTTDGSAGRPGTVDGPLVTIIVSVFRPTESLLAAVGSLIAQTWRNLQVVLVDDSSPEEYRTVLEQACALDPRVEYVRTPSNGGTYRARNLGITRARGDFVGFQDGDDWSHPERVERQMRAFADPQVVATLSKAVWLHDDLRVTVPGAQPVARIAPSLILRQDPTLLRLGPFDEMRRAADTEFIERVATEFGRHAVVTLDEPLSLYQLTRGSLSRGDFRLGWRRDARVSYHSAFRYWHRQIADQGAVPVIESSAGRAFPAPPEIEGTDHPATVDLVLLADFRPRLVEYAGLPAEIEALAAGGTEVGLARGEAVRHAAVARDYPHEDIQRVVARGLADWRPLSAALTTRTLLVRDPDLLAFPRAASGVRMRPARVLVVADRVPRPAGTPRVSYDPAHVEQVAQAMFGVEVEWLPATTTVSEALVEAGATAVRHPPHVLEVALPQQLTSRPLDQRPVIGASDVARFAADRVDPVVLDAVLPRDNAYDVRILESSERPRRRAGADWLAFTPSLLTPEEFFDQCDFVVGFPARVDGTRLVRPVIDAMARGCIPVTHPSHRDVLGDAAFYYGDRTVAQVVDEVWSDPGRHHAARVAAVEFCHTRFAPEALAGAITRITGSEPS